MATTAHGEDEEKVRALGASEVIDYTKADFAELLSDYDVVLDSLGGDSLTKSLTVLKPGGLAISVVGPPDAAFAAQVGRPLLKPVMARNSTRWPLDAMAYLEQGRANGKVVVSIPLSGT